MHRRIAFGQRRRVHPVGGRGTAVQQTRRGQHEGAGAQADDAGPFFVGPADGVECLLRRRRGDRPPGRHDDGARPRDRFQAMRCGEFQPSGRAQRAFFATAHKEAVARNSGVLPVDSEHRQRYGTLEDGAAAEQQHRDDLLAASPGKFPGRGFRRGSGVVAHTAKPPRWSRLLGCVAPARFPSVLHESPAVRRQDRIYCVQWCRGDQFGNRHIVDMATWREAFDHEALHSWAVQGSAPRRSGQSP